MKSYLVWQEVKSFCKNNPGKKAAIFTPDGIYTITFEARNYDVHTSKTYEGEWLKSYYIEPNPKKIF